MNLEEIKKHWEDAGKYFSDEGKVTPTSRDPFLALLEKENIMSYLERSHRVLELGCGDASHTIQYARKVEKLLAIDIAQTLVDRAKQRLAQESISNVELTVGSILELDRIYRAQNFDCILSQRCLINLPEWSYQRKTILQVRDLLAEGGLFLLTEGFQEEYDQLNAVRKHFGLDIINTNYNRSLVRREFEDFIAPYFNILEVRDYGAYLFFSRVLHPLAVYPRAPKHDAAINEAAMRVAREVTLPDFKAYSFNLFYALKKK